MMTNQARPRSYEELIELYGQELADWLQEGAVREQWQKAPATTQADRRRNTLKGIE